MDLIHCRKVAILLMLSFLNGGVFFSAVPAAAQGPAAIMEKPGPEKAAEEKKKEETPQTCGPIISDSCLPIEEHHASLQVLTAFSLYPGLFSNNWRYTSAKGNYYTFFMPIKFTYGPTKNLEMYVIAPFISNLCNSLDAGIAGPNGERSAGYSGIGDITAVAKYLLLEETDFRPAVTGVGGVGFPTGHAHHLNPASLNQDAIGTGAFTFTTGVNLYKWLKPFLVYSNIWLNSPVNLYTSNSRSVRSREFVTFNLAMEYPINKKWVALLEMYSNWTWTNISTPQGFQSPSTLLGLLPGIEYFITEWAVSAGTAVDLMGKSGCRKITPMLTTYYSF
jgi:hypothetical protein